MNQELEKYVDFLFNVVEQAHVNSCLLMDTNGTILKFNPLFTKTFGYHPEDILGQHFSILFTEEDRALYKPQKELDKVIHAGWAQDKNYVRCVDGTWLWVSGESLLLRQGGANYIIKLVQDIHAHKLTQYEALMLKDFNENILSSIEDSILVLDGHKNIIKYNEAFLRMCKRTENLSFGYFANLISSSEDRIEFEKSVNEVISRKVPFRNIVVELQLASGEHKVFQISGQPLINKLTGETILLTMHDISAFKKMEREREDILGFVAHELRNPLTNLVLCNKIIEMSLSGNDRNTALDTLAKSKNNIERLTNMVAQLYRATEVRGGEMLLDITSFDSKQMIQEAVEIVSHERSGANIQTGSIAQLELEGDRFKLIQVVTNYLNNAIKYSGADAKILVTAWVKDNMFTVSVHDNGPGIAPENQPYIFDRYFRIEKTRNLEGIGLGLYLCKRIILAHRGKVWVKSEENKGSVFYFSIPLSDAKLQ